MGSGEYRTLVIHSTDITEIERNIFSQIIFDYIYIDNNRHLVRIDPLAFKKSPAMKSLMIVNNPFLADLSIFELSRNLLPSDTIGIIGNGITEIPENAFLIHGNVSHVKHIQLSNNKITKIGANAFVGHPLLEQLTLDHNNIQQLDNYSLNLNYSHNSGHSGQVFVFLNSNNLTSNSFAVNVFGNPQMNGLAIDLENNNLTKLPENVFRPFVSIPGSVVYLYNNNFACDCGMKWIISQSTADQIQGLYCVNIANSIHGLTERQLGCSARK